MSKSANHDRFEIAMWGLSKAIKCGCSRSFKTCFEISEIFEEADVSALKSHRYDQLGQCNNHAHSSKHSKNFHFLLITFRPFVILIMNLLLRGRSEQPRVANLNPRILISVSDYRDINVISVVTDSTPARSGCSAGQGEINAIEQSWARRVISRSGDTICLQSLSGPDKCGWASGSDWRSGDSSEGANIVVRGSAAAGECNQTSQHSSRCNLDQGAVEDLTSNQVPWKWSSECFLWLIGKPTTHRRQQTSKPHLRQGKLQIAKPMLDSSRNCKLAIVG